MRAALGYDRSYTQEKLGEIMPAKGNLAVRYVVTDMPVIEAKASAEWSPYLTVTPMVFAPADNPHREMKIYVVEYWNTGHVVEVFTDEEFCD